MRIDRWLVCRHHGPSLHFILFSSFPKFMHMTGSTCSLSSGSTALRSVSVERWYYDRHDGMRVMRGAEDEHSSMTKHRIVLISEVDQGSWTFNREQWPAVLKGVFLWSLQDSGIFFIFFSLPLLPPSSSWHFCCWLAGWLVGVL